MHVCDLELEIWNWNYMKYYVLAGEASGDLHAQSDQRNQFDRFPGAISWVWRRINGASRDDSLNTTRIWAFMGLVPVI